MSVRISLALEASEMFLSLHMIFSLERAAVVCAILERISDFDPSLKMIAPRYLKFSTSSSLLTFYLDLSLEAIWVVCHHFSLVWADLHSVPLYIDSYLPAVIETYSYTPVYNLFVSFAFQYPMLLGS